MQRDQSAQPSSEAITRKTMEVQSSAKRLSECREHDDELMANSPYKTPRGVETS
jgi:hypothetical protein